MSVCLWIILVVVSVVVFLFICIQIWFYWINKNA